jgi:hypothetical protein
MVAPEPPHYAPRPMTTNSPRDRVDPSPNTGGGVRDGLTNEAKTWLRVVTIGAIVGGVLGLALGIFGFRWFGVQGVVLATLGGVVVGGVGGLALRFWWWVET